MTREPRPPRPATRPQLAPAIAVAAVFLAPGASAGTFYDFSWSFPPYSATGTMELSSVIGVGEMFDIGDVMAITVELFDGATSVATIASPPVVFNPPFDAIDGTRNESTLSMRDFLVSNGVLFGCDAGDCLSGMVFFPGAPGGRVDFGSIQAARDSFVFVQGVPEPPGTALAAAAVAALAALVSARSRPRG